jgi:hypothetical protein
MLRISLDFAYRIALSTNQLLLIGSLEDVSLPALYLTSLMLIAIQEDAKRTAPIIQRLV